MADYEQAKETISEGLEFLRRLGFDEPATSIEQSKLLGDSLLMIYAAAAAQRHIEVSYVAENGEHAAAISVFVCNAEGERFSLEDWVQQEVPARPLRFLADRTSDSERTFLEKFCLEFQAVLEGPLRNTVTGKDWDGVALDWKGYR